MTSVLAPIEFYPPLANPSTQGLYSVVNWTEQSGPSRFLAAGVRIRPQNYGGEDAIGVWTEDWCDPDSPTAVQFRDGDFPVPWGSGSPGSQLKTGVRPLLPDPFPPLTVWSYDECDPTPASQAEVLERVQQNLRLGEPIAVEMLFAGYLVGQAAAINPPSRGTFREGIAYLEGQLARTNTLGVIHASAEAASLEWGIVLPSGAGLRTPLGHAWAFGGGYVDTLGDLIIATSPLFGWRDQVTVRPTFEHTTNTYAAVAERSVVIGYEKLVAAVYVEGIGS